MNILRIERKRYDQISHRITRLIALLDCCIVLEDDGSITTVKDRMTGKVGNSKNV